MPIEAGSLQEENTPTNVHATIRNIWGGQRNSRKRSVPGHPDEWRIIMNTQKSFALFYSFTTPYYFIFLQSLTKILRFYRKVAFLMYTEMVNFRPQS